MKKQDYEIRIKANNNDRIYWQLLRKGDPAVPNEKELKMVADMCIEIRDKIVMVLYEKYKRSISSLWQRA